MSTPAPITNEEASALIAGIAASAFRLELQREYREPAEVDTIERFIAGRPQDPTEVPSLATWYARVADLTRGGRRIGRVRVHDEPPTSFQRWERWAGAWNTAAGETLHYLTRRQAHDIGLLPAAGDTDWWLLDERQLILMRFDRHGHRIHNSTTTDPTLVEQARTWRHLAVRHGVLEPGDAAAPTRSRP